MNVKERPSEFTIDRGHPLAQDLVFAGLGRHTGSTYYHDSSLKGNHGSLTNMDPVTGWVSAIGRRALKFDGSNDYVTCGEVKITKGLVISALFIPGTGFRGICQCGALSSSLGNWSLNYHANTIRFNQNGAGVVGSLVPVASQWNHVLAWCPVSGAGKLWVNGKVDPTWTGTNASSTAGTLYVGVYYATGSVWTDRLADVLIYDTYSNPTAMVERLADTSNAMLSLGGSDQGMLQYRRKWWPVGTPVSVPTANSNFFAMFG